MSVVVCNGYYLSLSLIFQHLWASASLSLSPPHTTIQQQQSVYTDFFKSVVFFIHRTEQDKHLFPQNHLLCLIEISQSSQILHSLILNKILKWSKIKVHLSENKNHTKYSITVFHSEWHISVNIQRYRGLKTQLRFITQHISDEQ